MSTEDHEKISDKGVTDERPGSVDLMRHLAGIAVWVGAVGSAGLMLIAGHPPILLRVLFTIWVISPFVILLLANAVADRRAFDTRITLYVLMLVVAFCSLAVYGYVVLRPHETTPTAVFVVVPPVS